jgi:hypothetical protein
MAHELAAQGLMLQVHRQMPLGFAPLAYPIECTSKAVFRRLALVNPTPGRKQINNAAARIAGMLAVALVGTLAVGVFARVLDERLTELQTPAEIRQALHAEITKLAEAEVPARVCAQRQSLQRDLNVFRVEFLPQ